MRISYGENILSSLLDSLGNSLKRNEESSETPCTCGGSILNCISAPANLTYQNYTGSAEENNSL